MYRKSEVIYLSTFTYYTKYTIDYPTINAWLYDNVKKQDIYKLDYVPTPTTLLFDNQYSADLDKNQLFFSQNLIGKYVRVEYYTTGKLNPFYISTDISRFISEIFLRAQNNISSGLYFYQTEYDPEHIWRLSHGSVMYDGEFVVVKELTYNFKELAPPTLQNYCRCYFFFINKEVIESYLFRQTNTLQKVGMIVSDMYDSFDKAKLDTKVKYDNQYDSEPLSIGWIYLMVNQADGNYEFWIEYDQTVRGKM